MQIRLSRFWLRIGPTVVVTAMSSPIRRKRRRPDEIIDALLDSDSDVREKFKAVYPNAPVLVKTAVSCACKQPAATSLAVANVSSAKSHSPRRVTFATDPSPVPKMASVVSVARPSVANIACVVAPSASHSSRPTLVEPPAAKVVVFASSTLRHAVGSVAREEDQDEWQTMQVVKTKEAWTKWGVGIADFREVCIGKNQGLAGRTLRHCMDQVDFIAKANCHMKIGLCQKVSVRWRMYRDEAAEGEWVPNIMFLVASTETREAASFLEAALIVHMEQYHDRKSINLFRGDVGGEGPRRPENRLKVHHVYVVALNV